MKTAIRKGHDVTPNDEEKLQQFVISHIGENLQFARSALASSYYAYTSLGFYSPGQRGNEPEVAQMKFLLSFLDDFHRFSKRFSSLDPETKSRLTRYRLLFLLWTIASHSQLSHDASNVLSLKWCVDRKNYLAALSYVTGSREGDRKR